MTIRPTETDFVVIGAGVAGLRAAIALAEAGRVLVLAKKEVTNSNTQYAQGGIAAALSDEDEVSLHLQDTLVAGDGLCNPAAVKILVEEGPERIEELIAWGTQFDRAGTKLVFGREGAHSRNRILHAQGDSTGREILRALYAKAKALKNISVVEFEFSTGLLTDAGRVTGISLFEDKTTSGQNFDQTIFSSAVLLATGGMGQLYRNTTNPEVATGDGVAMAFRAGADVSDMEFIQFHPTALYLKQTPRFLLSEALRGEGAYLRTIELQRFMGKYHSLGELAPRDVVARAIVHEMEVSGVKDPFVYLDLTHLNATHIRRRFPRIYATCMEYNINITQDLIPIRPAAHYSMGGVRTGTNGRTNIAGLYAAGEAAATGVHGANRLASNSLLEGLVYGARAGAAMRDEIKHPDAKAIRQLTAFTDIPSRSEDKNKNKEDGDKNKDEEAMIGEIQDVMWNNVGIVRTRTGLQNAISRLEELSSEVENPKTRRAHEAANLRLAGLLVARAALAREESRGAHYRTDFPDHNDSEFRKHSVANIADKDGPRFEKD